MHDANRNDFENLEQTLGYSNKTFFYTSSGRASFDLRDRYDLYEVIDPVCMRSAIEEALALYPEFKIRVDFRNGEFVSLKNDRPVPFFEGLEGEYRLGSDETNGYLFYAAYEKNSLLISFFHGLTDRAGMISFMGTVFFRYAMKTGVALEENELQELKGKIRFSAEDIPADPMARLDPYGLMAGGATEGENLYKSPGGAVFTFEEYPDESLELNRYLIEFRYRDFFALAKRHGLSAAVFLTYIASKAFGVTNLADQDRPVIAMLPVDFRKRIGVDTAVNCSDGILIPTLREDFDLSWEENCARMRKFMKGQISRENCVKIITDKVNMIRSFEAGTEAVPDIVERITRLPTREQPGPFTYAITLPGGMDMGKGIDKMIEDIHCTTFARASFVHGYSFRDTYRLDIAIRSDDGSWAGQMAKELEETGIPVTLKALGRTKGDVLDISCLAE